MPLSHVRPCTYYNLILKKESKKSSIITIYIYIILRIKILYRKYNKEKEEKKNKEKK
jgi:hypothetical protein